MRIRFTLYQRDGEVNVLEVEQINEELELPTCEQNDLIGFTVMTKRHSHVTFSG